MPTIMDYNDIGFYINLTESEIETIKHSIMNDLTMGMDLMEDKTFETLNNEVFNILENYSFEKLHIIKIDNMNNMTIFYTNLYRNFSLINQEEVINYIIRNPELYDLKEQEQLIIITDITLYRCYFFNGYHISVYDRGNQVFAQILEELTQIEQDGVNNREENLDEEEENLETSDEEVIEAIMEEFFDEGEQTFAEGDIENHIQMILR
jgi:hypothetical protein